MTEITYLNPRNEPSDDKIYGCAQVENIKNKPSLMGFINSFYYLILIVILYIVYKQRRFRFN